MGLRSLNNTASSFNDPYASTGLEAYLPSNAYFTGKWYGTYGIWAGGYRGAGGGGGGANFSTPGGPGGSGLVLIAYPT